jgi:hypothetical protein
MLGMLSQALEVRQADALEIQNLSEQFKCDLTIKNS